MDLIIGITPSTIFTLDDSEKMYMYEFENYSKISKSPALFFKSYLKEGENREAKIIYFFPISLLLVTNKEKDKIKLLEDFSNFERVRKELEKYGIDEIFPIQSIGVYEDITFLEELKEIEAFIFTKLVKEFISLKGKVERVYLDISAGHNIYVVAMLNAARRFIVFTRFYNLEEGIENKKTKFYLLFSEPIQIKETSSISKKMKIKVEEVDVLVFFTFPLDKNSWINNIILNKIKEKMKKDKKEFMMKEKEIESCKDIVKCGYLLFNAIKKCCPLVCFYVDRYSAEIIEKILVSYHEILLEEFKMFKLDKEKRIFDCRINIDGIKLMNTYISFSILIGIAKIFKNLGIEAKNEIELNELKKFFEIFRILKLDTNILLLENELNVILGKVKSFLRKNKIESNKFYRISEIEELLYERKKQEEKEISSNIERNFLAHAGLEKNKTKIRVEFENENIRIYIKYDEKEVENLKNFKGEIYSWVTKE